jgi:DNA-directed RNA polymerase specialized sigma24 family protein
VSRPKSRDAIRASIEAMTELEHRQVVAVAKGFARRYRLPVDDLLQEAFVRALSTRNCGEDVSIVAFLAGIIKSVSWDGLKERTDGAVAYGEDLAGKVMEAEAQNVVSAEDAALSKIINRKHLAACCECIQGDGELELLVEGLFDGLRGGELEELLGADTKGLAAAKRRLARRLQEKYPAGIPL